jgi:tetratricopeptide (TPR) repeat protein
MPEESAEIRTRQLQEIVERDPSTALYLPLAERLREEGRVEEAIRLCEERRNRPGKGVGDAVVLGRCYLADGRLGDARAAFEAALSLDRENVAALKALAGILAHEGRPSNAADLYRAVCRVDPGDLESQTALHQISSGEYAEVCPAEVVVGQGDLGWQPVRLPREEDHLSDLGLGLRTIESFDTAAPDAERRRARDFQEFTLEELERAPAAAARSNATLADERPSETLEETTQTPAASEQSEAEASAPEEARRPAVTSPPAPLKTTSGNRSAFEDWVRRLGGHS